MLTKDKIIKIIERKRNKFNAIIADCVTCSEPEKKRKKFYNALKFANNSDFGVYCSKEIEEYFCSLAKEIHIDLCKNPKPNSILHIATRLYDTGGHSRVLERWIELSPEHETHSVILTHNKKHVVSTRLKNAVAEKNGTIQEFELSLSDMEKAKQLRKISSEYERIILHIHMDDVVPLIAFGTTEFKRPVFFFNHADHRFWVGQSVADCIINLRTYGINCSSSKRNCLRNELLPLPLDQKTQHIEYDNEQLKKELSLPVNKKIIFSGGHKSKFTPLLDIDFGNYAAKILQQHEDCIFLLLGPSKKEINIPNQYEKRVIFINTVPYQNYLKYLACSDLVIDSFPMSGATLVLDAVQQKLPVLSYCEPIGQMDYILNTPAYCKDIDELIQKTLLYLQDDNKKHELAQKIYEEFQKNISIENWKKNLIKIYQSYTAHNIYPVTPKNNFKIGLQEFFLCKEKTKTNNLQKILNFFKK